MYSFYRLNSSALKAEAKAKIQGRLSSLIIAAAISIGSSILSNFTDTKYIYIEGEYVNMSTTTGFSTVFSFFIAPIIAVGIAKFFLNFANNREYGLDDIKYAFNNYGQILLGMLWKSIFEVLWTLLFIIPGIIKGIAYSMTKYILAENPNVGFKEAIKISMVLTDGRKGEIFGVMLSFIGWFILMALSCGIAGLYVIPLYETTMAQVYEQVKGDAIAQGRIDANIFDPAVYRLEQ